MNTHQTILAPDVAAIRSHLTAWAAPYIGTEFDDGLLEIAYTAPGEPDVDRGRLFPLDQIEAAVAFAADQNARRCNCYIGAALRAPDAAPHKRASALDFYAAAYAAAEADDDADAVAARIEAMGTRGAIRVRTGQTPEKRVHHWLRLREACDDPVDYGEALVALVAHVGADPKVKDSARVLRLGGTVNWITDPRKVAKGYVDELTAVVVEDAPAVDLDRLAALEPMPGWAPKSSGGGGGGGAMGEIIRNAAGLVTDGREAFWLKLVMRAVADFQRQHGADPEVGETFDTAFERFVAETVGDDRWTSPRGQVMLRKRVQNTLRRLRSGHLARHGLWSRETGIGREEADAVQARRDRERGLHPAPDWLDEGQTAEEAARALHLPRGFIAKRSGIFRVIEGDDGKTEYKWLCSPIRVLALPRDRANTGWGRLIEVLDPDGRAHRWSAPARMFAGDGTEIRARLYEFGFDMATDQKSRQSLSELLQRWKPPARALTADRLGWSDETCAAFILGDGRVIGADNIVYQHEDALTVAAEMKAAGTLQGWQEAVAAPCVGNPLLVLGASLAFAGPLLEPLSLDGGGVHLRGASSRGKSTVQRVAVSVWGSPKFLHSWRGTDNGHEGLAATCNGSILALDEIAEISGRDAGKTAYMLANGVGKARAGRDGRTRNITRWRVMILSSGEISLADKMAEAGGRAAAGQAVRLLDIGADSRAHGTFDDLHGAHSGASFADRMKVAAAMHYGTAGPAFVERFLADRVASVERVRVHMDAFRKKAVERFALASEGQIERAVARIGLIAAAGELATAFDLTGWPAGTATDAALDVLGIWLQGRGGAGSAEAREAVERTRAFLVAHGASRFEPIGTGVTDGPDGKTILDFNHPAKPDRPVVNRAGWVDTGIFYIGSDAWQEIHRGCDATRAARHVRDAGFLQPGERGRLTQKMSRGVRGRPRVYAVAEDIMGAGDD